MNALLVVIILFMPLFTYLVQYEIKRRKWPHTWTCSECKANGTTITFSSNKFDITRYAQLRHLDEYHPA